MLRYLLALELSQESKTALIANSSCRFGSADTHGKKHKLTYRIVGRKTKGGKNWKKLLAFYLVPEGNFSPVASR